MEHRPLICSMMIAEKDTGQPLNYRNRQAPIALSTIHEPRLPRLPLRHFHKFHTTFKPFVPLFYDPPMTLKAAVRHFHWLSYGFLHERFPRVAWVKLENVDRGRILADFGNSWRICLEIIPL